MEPRPEHLLWSDLYKPVFGLPDYINRVSDAGRMNMYAKFELISLAVYNFGLGGFSAQIIGQGIVKLVQ